MNESRRISHGVRRYRSDARPELRPLRFRRLQFSNRQILLVDSGVTCCKQTFRARSNRQNLRGSAKFDFQICNLKSQISVPVSTRKHFRVESTASHSKQRLGAPATRKYFGGPGHRFSSFHFRFSVFSILKRVSTKTRCFPAQVVQNTRSAHEKGVNFLQCVFRPNLDFRDSVT